MRKLFDARYGKNWMYFILRAVTLIVFSILLYLRQPITEIIDFSTIQHIVIPAVVGVIGLVIFSVVVLIRSIKVYAPFAVLMADLALVAAYVYFLPPDDYLLLTVIPSVIAVSGILRIGSILSTFEALGVILVSGIALAIAPQVGFEMMRANPSPYVSPVLINALLSLLAAIWSYTLDEENDINRVKVREEIEDTRSRLSSMRERTAAIAELATRLNSTLNYERILDAALDIARISIRNEGKSHTVSMAVMIVDDDETMEIGDARGLQNTDMHHKFKGREGLMARTMDEGYPIIVKGKLDDPELHVVRGMANAKTTLCIPLRANFETYGVLVFASDQANAINEDHIDTLAAIGVQTTVALQNAVLYNNLREEKERIIRIEENGRKSLVRDLHDVPTQTVSAVAMHLSTLPTLVERHPERLKNEVDNIRSMALRATEEIRHVMFTLRPLALETNGLSVALEQLAEKMGKTYKQAMQVKVNPRVEDVLEREAQGTLFYLIEEAANNARKYAQASMIQVTGTVQDDEVIVRIRDNGKGFDTTAVNANYESRSSFGMVNMRERAELINATFELQSVVGKGTSVTVRVPIKDENLSQGVKIIKPRRALRKQYSGPLSPNN